MIVTLDGERLAEPLPAGGTLQALIDQVRRAHLGERLVVSVAVDGKPLLNEELSARLEGSLAGATQVDFTSADRRQLAADVLHEVAEQLGQAHDQQAAIAERLNAGAVSEAVSRFGEFMQVWQACQQALAECSRLLGQDLTAADCAGQPVREHLDALADKLRELRDAFEARDMVLVADVVQYEMPEICCDWQGILNALAEEILGSVSDASAN